MMFLEFLRVGWTVIRAHKFRSALTLLSIAIGTFSIVLMASLASSATATIFQGLEDLGGARMIVFFPQRPEKAEKKGASYNRGLTVDDADALRGRIPYVRYFEVHRSMGDREVSDASQQGLAGALPVRKSADLVAANQDFFGSFGMTIAAGRALHPDDLLGRRRVVVLGHAVAEALFPNPEAALGRVIRAGTDSFRVIGVTAKLTRMGVDFDFDWNNFLAVPLTIGMTADSQTAMLLVTEGMQHNDVVKRLAAAVISDRHNHVDDFKVFDFSVIMEKFYEVFRVMQLIAGLIASVALLVGGMGVMNILLVSVSERVREIGIRKAIGASDKAVGMQFLFESALLSGLGGAVGAALGCPGVVLAGVIITAQSDAGQAGWVTVISQPALLAALVSSVLIGVFFGLVPARKAGKLQVVDCLRAAG